MPLRGINAAAYQGERIPEGTALTPPPHSAYLLDSQQLPKMSIRDKLGTEKKKTELREADE